MVLIQIFAIPSISLQGMDDEFGFLLCEWCKKDVKDPKLLPCLHNFCTECLEVSMSVGRCPICSTPHTQNAGTPKENVLFINLQANLSIYQKVLDGKDLLCNSCVTPVQAEFWCLECNEFFCVTCFGFHQKYRKHQTISLNDIKAESSKGFLAWIRKSSNVYCSNHTNEPLRYVEFISNVFLKWKICLECKELVILETKVCKQECEDVQLGEKTSQGPKRCR